MRFVVTALTLIGLLAVACGGGGGGGDNDGGSSGATGGNVATGSSGADGQGDATSQRVFIEPADADRVAHAGLPSLSDFGPGFEIVAEDAFDDEGGSDRWLEFIDGEESCKELEDLAKLEEIFGGDEAEAAPTGRAKVEFENANDPAFIPVSGEVEIEVQPAVADAQSGWVLAKQLLQSDQTSECFVDMLNSMFKETLPVEGVEVTVKRGERSVAPPQNGAVMAFDIEMSVAGTDLKLAMELYFWPYGNAEVKALFFGENAKLNRNTVGGILETVDANLTAATAVE